MKHAGSGFFRMLALTVIVFAALVGCACAAIIRIGSVSEQAQVEMVESAIRRAMLACYAVEGAYPMDIGHLKENYALAYNEDRFYVYYDAFASNVMPEVRVSPRGGDL